MKHSKVTAGIFVFSALVLFSVALFLIGTSHNAFTRHVTFYTELSEVNGITPGLKVRVGGFDAGEVAGIGVPDKPSGEFRIKLQIDDKVRNLVREDSVVTVESNGLVGDKFLLIHKGSEKSHEAPAGTTLSSKEPIELSAMMAKASDIMDQARGAIGDVQGRLDVSLDTVTKTVDNANGLVSDARHGKGTIGVLVNDPETASQLKQTVANAEQASANVKQMSVQAGQLVTDIQSRKLPAKLDDTVVTARNAAQQIDQASQKVNATLDDALGPDRSGENAAENIRESLSNVNLATANLAEDTEAIKHEFFFRGFFRKRGYYSLEELTPDQYRTNSFFQNENNGRSWLATADAFTADAKGNEILSVEGERQIDQIIGKEKDAIMDEPLVVEGYSSQETGANEIIASRSRSLLVAQYLEKHFHLRSMDIGIMPLNATPPSKSGKVTWDGACIVFLPARR
jgi:phospholipid/cholesterol/gamma-HCH transport system substrate-binding protein